MLNLKSTLFFGYHKATVDKLLEELRQEKEDLKERLSKQESIISELTAQLTMQKNKENLISDVLLEAQHTANQTILHVQEQSDLHIRKTYERLNNNVSQVQEKTTILENLNSKLIEFEQQMKHELREVLEQQMKALERIDLSNFESIKQEALSSIETSKDVIGSARKIIEFPEKKNTENSDEIPVFRL